LVSPCSRTVDHTWITRLTVVTVGPYRHDGCVVIVRATKKLRQRIGPPTLVEGDRSTTVLGDWYAMSLPWRPQVALLVSEATLLPVLMPLAPAASLVARLADHVATVLAAHGTPDGGGAGRAGADAGVPDRGDGQRSVVGGDDEFTFLADTYRTELGPDLLAMTVRLARTPCSPLYGTHGSPDRELAALVGSMAL
jgi:hypothetical protein